LSGGEIDGQLAEKQLCAARAIIAHLAEHLQADLSVVLWNGEVLPLGPGARDDIRLAISRQMLCIA